PPGGGHGPPPPRMDEGARARAARGRRGTRRRGNDRDRSIHHDARAGALVQDRTVRDRTATLGRAGARGRRVLAPRVPRPAARARIAPADGAPPRARSVARWPALRSF